MNGRCHGVVGMISGIIGDAGGSACDEHGFGAELAGEHG
jgi:hypothetical protein